MKSELEGLKQYTHTLKTALDAYRRVKESNRAMITDLQSALADSNKREARLLEALAEHSLYYLDPDGNELFDQPLNWEANLLDDIKEGRIDE